MCSIHVNNQIEWQKKVFLFELVRLYILVLFEWKQVVSSRYIAKDYI